VRDWITDYIRQQKAALDSIPVDAVNDGRAYMSGRKRIAEETARASS